eukprot:16428787-Heterocapsa_arctica.AAC.1
MSLIAFRPPKAIGKGFRRQKRTRHPPCDAELSHRALKTPTNNENNKTDHSKYVNGSINGV